MSGYKTTEDKIESYVKTWKRRGYGKDIPDEVPVLLMKENLAPSYKAICLAILRNDLQLQSLGFSVVPSEWYSVLKGIEIRSRESAQGRLF